MKWLFSMSKKKKMKVEFCQQNLDRFLQEEDAPFYEEFLNSANIVYKEYECQSYCEVCLKNVYALVNGQMITAKTSQELLVELKNKM